MNDDISYPEHPYIDLEQIAEEQLENALAILTAIDTMEISVSDWEANFMNSIMQQSKRKGFMLSEKQMGVIERLEKKYL